MRAMGRPGGSMVDIVVRVVEPSPDRVREAVEDLQRLPVAHRINAGRIPLVFAFSGDPVITGLRVTWTAT